MKKCPFCGEVIEDDVTKCLFCGKPLVEAKKKGMKWYHSTASLIIGFLLVQPFILPAVWSHPRFSRTTKLVITVIVLVLTYLLCVWIWDAMKGYFKIYQDVLNGKY